MTLPSRVVGALPRVGSRHDGVARQRTHEGEPVEHEGDVVGGERQTGPCDVQVEVGLVPLPELPRRPITWPRVTRSPTRTVAEPRIMWA